MWHINITHGFHPAEETGSRWLMSPHQFGWPEHRPRSYTCLTLRATCELEPSGLQSVFEIMRRPTMPVDELYCAPQEPLPYYRVYLFFFESAFATLCPLTIVTYHVMTHDAAAWLHDVVIICSMYICRVHKVANIYIYIYRIWRGKFNLSLVPWIITVVGRCRRRRPPPSAQDLVEAARREAAHKACRALASPFHDLLGGFPAET